MFNRIHIRQHETGLVFHRGEFERVLEPGTHLVFSLKRKVEVFDRLQVKFEHNLLEILVKEPLLAQRLTVLEINDMQRALVWKEGRLGWILGPGKYAFWQEPVGVECEMYDLTEGIHFRHAKLNVVMNHPQAPFFLQDFRAENHEDLLVFHDGRFIERLQPGLHVFWRKTGVLKGLAVEKREQSLDVTGQEIMTSDKVTLRLNLLVNFKVIDAEKAALDVQNYQMALYKEAQLALRAVVGTRTLDYLLSEKDVVGREIQDQIESRLTQFGLKLCSMGLKDIILPGEMKTILNQVTEAQKQAEANLIKRREETAAARSQANTAKLYETNPVLLKLKELEAVQEILSGADTTFILGNADLGGQLRALAGVTAHKTSGP